MSLDLMQAYSAIANIDEPNPMQTAVWQAFQEQTNIGMGIGLLLKGLTGSGKSEAVAIPAIANDRRLIMVYPTRSLVDDQIGRFHKWLTCYSKHNNGQLVTLTVDTGAQSIRCCYRNGKQVPTPGSERSTRHLYTGSVIITTLDKFIYRFFGFGEPLKSYIYPLRIRYMNPIICFDEAHSYDKVSFINFERLISTLYKNGKDIILMTATMPLDYLRRFRDLDTLDFTDGEGAEAMVQWKSYPYPAKQLHLILAGIERQEDAPSEAVECIISEIRKRYEAEKRMIATVESVKDATTIYRQLRDEYPNIHLYHGRLTQNQRETVYKQLKAQDKNGSYLLISTSAIEVGCDLNAHILITQLCDPDRLIQRAGRCNRKQEIPNAAIIVVGDAIPEWATALNEDQLSKYRQALQTQSGFPFDPSLLTPLIHKELIRDPRVEVMFDMLYEYVYEARLENKNLHENGLVITRSWEPSITLSQGETDKGLLNPVTVPISYCRVPKDQEPVRFLMGPGFYKRAYDKETHKPVLQPLGNRWENGYSNDIVVCLEDYEYADGTPFEDALGYVDLPFLFNGPFRRGSKLILEHGVEQDKLTIWYIDPDNVTIKANEMMWATAVTTAAAHNNPGDEEEPT